MRNRQIVNTRAREQASELTSLLELQGAEVLLLPCLEIHPTVNQAELRDAVSRMERQDWLLFTSANGVRAVQDTIELTEVRCAAIGDKTALVIRETGAMPEFVGEGMSSEQLAEEFLSYVGKQTPAPRVLLLRGDIASEALPTRLEQAGLEVERHQVYTSMLPVLSSVEQDVLTLLADGSQVVDMLVFTSSQAVRNFYTLLSGIVGERAVLDAVKQIPLAVLGEKTARTARQMAFDVVLTAPTNTIEALVAEIAEFFD